MVTEHWRFPHQFLPVPKPGGHGLNFIILTPEDGPYQLAKVDYESRKYRVIREYPVRNKSCPGTIGIGYVGGISFPNKVVVHCVKGKEKPSTHGIHYWSEVLDLDTERSWRTKLYVQAMAADGTLIAGDEKIHASYSRQRRVFVGKL